MLEDRILRASAADVVGASKEQLERWSARDDPHPLQTAILPLAVLGSGAMTVGAKLEAVAHGALLQCSHDGDPRPCQDYALSVVALCSDYGVEGHLSEVPSFDLKRMQLSNVKASKGALKIREDTPGSELLAVQDDDSSLVLRLDDDDEPPRCGGPRDSDEQGPDSPVHFGLNGSLLVPGIKHILNNIEEELVQKLAWYNTFEDACSPLFAVSSTLQQQQLKPKHVTSTSLD